MRSATEGGHEAVRGRPADEHQVHHLVAGVDRDRAGENALAAAG